MVPSVDMQIADVTCQHASSTLNQKPFLVRRPQKHSQDTELVRNHSSRLHNAG